MVVNTRSLWFTQMIEYDVPPLCQDALAEALVVRSEQLAQRCEGLLSVSIQASDDGRRVLQHLQWQSRQAWVAAAGCFVEEPFLELLRRYQARGVNFAAYQTLRSLVRGADGGLHCQLGETQAYQGA
ncbi:MULTISPECIES: antibiotic biosynthesis monooxygenase [unclassified Pseudomonas]|uniref:antibiotic biosynthesis monooxygenase n=1 Tax=unclassified Pseudomonas TaxID=196821 RepID=UPI00244B8FDB|nr:MULTISPECIES: antibiotic biosynthesis monooxygenase [unclassified Pseudomonas]MDH0305088.1 antibiotic biosynthesis monooxygenase [Pseudomonas sp. GD04091]MDH1985540.1 antibiotic biosynthesis monooxygenase [Pseudomonas sp. GD03689]